ncbi:MAG: thioredoxin family protein [Nanoarchaeota archaeon]|nr:thioredoxin family protein [Nanoarchaeota archaeon]MBU1854541.1 thioredoxin family protein [Nanoarchaeota archaeon]
MAEVSSGLFLSDPLKIGRRLKDFSLKGVDGKKHSLSDFSTRKILVVVFISNNSKYSHAYNSRLVAIQNRFEEKGVQLICINSNDDSYSIHDGFYKLVEQARKHGYNFPYLKDSNQDVAKAFDAVCTPEAFVFDEHRVLRYRGRIDDNWSNPFAVKVNYIARAIKEIFEGKVVSMSETTPFGDSIKWHF